METTDWRVTQWKTHRDNGVLLRNGDSARIVWSAKPATDVAYVVPTDGDNGNTNAMLIAMAPDIMRCLLLASTCLRDCESSRTVKKFVAQAKELLCVDLMNEG
jgi:hypothetical protein